MLFYENIERMQQQQLRISYDLLLLEFYNKNVFSFRDES